MAQHQTTTTRERMPSKKIRFEFSFQHRQEKPSDKGARGGGKRLGFIGKMVEVIGQCFRSAAEPIPTSAAILVPVREDADAEHFPTQTVWEVLERTAAELRANVATGKPRRHNIALTDTTLVPLLKAVAQYQREGDPAPMLVDDSGRHEIPILNVQDFDEPLEEDSGNQSDTFQVVGLRVTKHSDVQLLFTHDYLAVRPTPEIEQQMLTWPCHVFRGKVWIEGTIIRDDEGVWQLTEGAKVVMGEPLAYTE